MSEQTSPDSTLVLIDGPDGVPGSAEPWASGLRGAVLTGLMVSPWAAEAGPIRAAVMADLYAEVADLLATARADAWNEGYIARTGDTPRYRGPAEWGNPYRDYPAGQSRGGAA